jgi:hypothetical protein
MGLFALTNIPGARVVRIPLSQQLSGEIDAVFQAQFAAFMNGIGETIPFDGRYKPDPGELLAIENYQDVDNMAGAVANPLGVDQFDPATHPLQSIRALFSGLPMDGGGFRILIQLFESRRLVATKGVTLFFTGNTFQKMTDAGLALDTKLLAVLEGATLKFQSFHFLSRALDVGEHYNEATNEDMAAFAGHEKLQVDNMQMFLANASSQVRRKIALIKQSGVLDNYTTEQIVATAQTFNVGVQTSAEGKIVLPTNPTQLKRLLRFLDEDYYESPLSQTRFLSNSKRVAD